MFFFKQKTAYEIASCLVGSEMCIRDRGRRKFLTPLYAKLVETESGKALAKEIYTVARPGYHSVSRDTIDEILKE